MLSTPVHSNTLVLQSGPSQWLRVTVESKLLTWPLPGGLAWAFWPLYTTTDQTSCEEGKEGGGGGGREVGEGGGGGEGKGGREGKVVLLVLKQLAMYVAKLFTNGRIYCALLNTHTTYCVQWLAYIVHTRSMYAPLCDWCRVRFGHTERDLNRRLAQPHPQLALSHSNNTYTCVLLLDAGNNSAWHEVLHPHTCTCTYLCTFCRDIEAVSPNAIKENNKLVCCVQAHVRMEEGDLVN